MTSIPALPVPAAAGASRSSGAGAAGSTPTEPAGFLAALEAIGTAAGSTSSGGDTDSSAGQPEDEAFAADPAAALEDVLTQLGLRASWATPSTAAVDGTPASVGEGPAVAVDPLAAAISGMHEAPADAGVPVATGLPPPPAAGPADALPGASGLIAHPPGPLAVAADAPTPAGLVGTSHAPLPVAVDAGDPDFPRLATPVAGTPQPTSATPGASVALPTSPDAAANALPLAGTQADPTLSDRHALPPAPATAAPGLAAPAPPVLTPSATAMAAAGDPVTAAQPSVGAAETAAAAAAMQPGAGEGLRMDADGPSSTPLQAAFALPEARTAESAARPAPLLAPVPMPSNPENGFDDVLATRIGWMADKGIGHARIHVTPEHLGSIDLQIRLDGDSLSAEFHSSQSDVRSALESGLARLREQLAEHGLKLVQAEVGDGQHAGDGRKPEAGGAQPEGQALHAGTVDVAAVPASPSRRGLVDAWA